MESLLPRQTSRRRKQGFIVPTDEWMRGSLRDFVGDVLLGRFGQLSVEREQARLFREEADSLRTSTRALVPRLDHRYRPVSRPEHPRHGP